MPQKDFAKIGEQIMILLVQGPNARERIFERKFETDESERIVSPVEAYACRHQSGTCFRHGAQRDELRVAVRLLDEDLIVPDREVAVQERCAKSLVGVFLHKAAPDFVETYMIVSGEMACVR
jgi:hypothetical protein